MTELGGIIQPLYTTAASYCKKEAQQEHLFLRTISNKVPNHLGKILAHLSPSPTLQDRQHRHAYVRITPAL